VVNLYNVSGAILVILKQDILTGGQKIE
jgi:hypothetical protein